MYKINKFKIIQKAIIVVLAITTIHANSQYYIPNSKVKFYPTKYSSPFSYYGIGDLFNDKSVNNMGMGGLSYSYRNPLNINYSNPASYTIFDTTSFVFESGLFSNTVRFENNDSYNQYNKTNMGYLLFGFPVTKHWGSSFGLVPVSNHEYNMNFMTTSQTTDDIKYHIYGNGGIQRLYLGNSVELLENLSIGANISYIFGSLFKNEDITIDNIQKLYYVDEQTINIGGLGIEGGIQYYTTLKDDLKLTIGATYNPKQKLNSTYDYSLNKVTDDPITNYYSSSYGTFYEKNSPDTAYKFKYKMPENFGFGISFSKDNKWFIGAETQIMYWEKNNMSELISDSLRNLKRLSIGGEYITEKLIYRAGIRVAQSYIHLNGHQIEELGISFGVGIPMKKMKKSKASVLNIGIEIGQRGNIQQNNYQEKYIKATISMNFYNRWFIKRKFD